MKHSKFIKAITLLSFVFFITLFLLYRTGKFDAFLSNEESPLQTFNDNISHSSKIDTLIPKKDSSQRLMFPSSKSIVLSDKRIGLRDSLYKKNQSTPFKRKKSELMMSSSKSGTIIKPIPFKKDKDSIRIDTISYKPIGRQ